VRWLVDGTNVVGSRPDGWWRDRPAAFRRLVEALGALAAAGDEVTVVFDGRPAAGLEAGDHGGVTVRWADRRGHDAADDTVVDAVTADPDPASRVVVTSDRGLAARVGALGAPVEGAGAFRRQRLGEGSVGTDTRSPNEGAPHMAGDSGPEAGAKGIVEDLKGKAKDAIGNLTGNEDLEREGEAQQAKADSQREVAAKEAEAEKARAEASAQEAQQRANQS
jgi:uncharacterized protein YjbJ (UPF0337 family)